jgi:hypothetical protein
MERLRSKTGSVPFRKRLWNPTPGEKQEPVNVKSCFCMGSWFTADTLDSSHETTSDRPSYPNKLSKASRRDLTFRVFDQYLPFVENVSKYTGGSVS